MSLPKTINQFIQSCRLIGSQLISTKQISQQKLSNLLTLSTQLKKGILMSQKILINKQCIILITKYQQFLRKNGSQFNQKNNSHCILLFKNVIDQVVKITQQQKNDQNVLQSGITQAVFQFLQAMAITSQTYFSNQVRKPLLMRKNSLKKVQDLPTIRPLSRGKLSSLSKKQPVLTSKKQILDNRPLSKQDQRQARSLYQQMIYGICCIVKNLGANVKVRKGLLKQQYLRLINRYLCIWNQKNNSQFGTQLMVQLTAFYRHLAVEQKCHKMFIKSNCFDSWSLLIQLFPTCQDIIFNLLRIISKLSNYQSVCIKLNQKKRCLKTLCSFFKFYKTNIHIIIRLAFIFANMTSYLNDIRMEVYFQYQVWADVFQCFDYYAVIQLGGKNQTDKMGLSMAAWDYQAIKKESDIEAVIKIIRFIANIFTVSQIGKDIYINQASSYKELIKKLRGLLQKKSNIQKSSELIACILSCLTNVLFYDRQLLMSNPEYKSIKCGLVTTLVDFVVQIDNQQICCQALRVVSNISRMKQFIKIILQTKIDQAILILLQSTSKQIVYYSLGILINLMVDNEFKQKIKEQMINSVIQILASCQSQDFDLVSVGLKTLAILVQADSQNINPQIINSIQACLINLGSHCDKIIISKDQALQSTQLHSIQQSRALINSLLNSMPQEKYVCPVKNCGRKFGDQAKMQDHIKRRHKLS